MNPNQGTILLKAIEDNPKDLLAKYAYADWLEELGDFSQTVYAIRWMAKFKRHPRRITDPDSTYSRLYLLSIRLGKSQDRRLYKNCPLQTTSVLVYFDAGYPSPVSIQVLPEYSSSYRRLGGSN